ncbi:MAG: EAL and HDOD domain-containing protein [Candidatus Alkaliphilus sp. MAG34]
MFIARQPIFKKNLDIYGYELLYRSGSDSVQFDGISSHVATATVIEGLFESGVKHIVEDRWAFINFDEKIIHSNTLELIGPSKLIIEILEDVEINQDLIERIKFLKDKGYKIALDDFIEKYENYPLIPFADIIKFDLIATPLETIRADVYLALSQRKILLAEKIETKEEFLVAREMGFHLFQGYFFSKPSIAGKVCNKFPSKFQYIRLITELKKEEPSYLKLAKIIRNDVQLAYRLMRIVSVSSGDELTYSIKRALVFMGLWAIERWINILMIRDMGGTKPEELIRISLIRTKFAEAIAVYSKFKNLRHEASMMGLFSVLDAVLDMTMKEALEGITIPESIKDVLIYKEGALGDIHKLIVAYERGNWTKVINLSEKINISADALSREYLNSIKWAKGALGILK